MWWKDHRVIAMKPTSGQAGHWTLAACLSYQGWAGWQLGHNRWELWFFGRIESTGMQSSVFTVCRPCFAVSELPGQLPKISVIMEDTSLHISTYEGQKWRIDCRGLIPGTISTLAHFLSELDGEHQKKVKGWDKKYLIIEFFNSSLLLLLLLLLALLQALTLPKSSLSAWGAPTGK